jgi:hypothetical protein
MDGEPTNHKAVYVVAAIVGTVALAIVGGTVWLVSQEKVMPDQLTGLVPLIVVGLLGWLAPSPLKNPAQPVTPPSQVRQSPAAPVVPNIDDVDPGHAVGEILGNQ